MVKKALEETKRRLAVTKTPKTLIPRKRIRFDVSDEEDEEEVSEEGSEHEDQSSASKALKPLSERTAKMKTKIGDVDKDAKAPDDSTIIQLANTSMTHRKRQHLAPMVWDYRGRLAKPFRHILDRNEEEGFWDDKHVRTMINNRDREAFFNARSNEEVSDAKGRPRKRDVKVLDDKRRVEGRYAEAKKTALGRDISKAGMSKLIDLRAQRLLGAKEYKGKAQRIKKQKQQLFELQVHQQKVDVQTHESHQKITKLFHKKHGEFVTMQRRLSRLATEKEAHVIFLVEWIKAHEIPVPSLEDLPDRLPKPPMPTKEIVKSGLSVFSSKNSTKKDNFGYNTIPLTSLKMKKRLQALRPRFTIGWSTTSIAISSRQSNQRVLDSRVQNGSRVCYQRSTDTSSLRKMAKSSVCS